MASSPNPPNGDFWQRMSYGFRFYFFGVWGKGKIFFPFFVSNRARRPGWKMINGFRVEWVTQKALSLPVSSLKKKKRKEKKKRGKSKKKMSQGKYSKITQPSLFYIRVCNNHGIQKPQLWSNDKDQCIKISFSFSLEIISPLSAADARAACTRGVGSRGAAADAGRGGDPAREAAVLSHRLVLVSPGSWPTVQPQALFVTSEILPHLHFCCSVKHAWKKWLPTEYPLATNADVNEQTANALKSKLKWVTKYT